MSKQKLMMHRRAIIKVDEEKKNVGEAKRKKKKRKWTYLSMYICSSLKRINFTKRERVNERNNSIFNSFEILNRKKVYACVMLTVDHPVVDGDGTSSLIHSSSSGISFLNSQKIDHVQKIFNRCGERNKKIENYVHIS